MEKRQLMLLHQQRVQAEMDDRKRRLLQKYVEALEVEVDDDRRIDVSCILFHQMSAPGPGLLPCCRPLLPIQILILRG